MQNGEDNQTELVSFATPDDLERVWRKLDTSEMARAEALMEQASDYLRQIAINNQSNLDQRIQNDATGILSKNVKMVVVDAVRRVLSTPADMPSDATQWTQSATPYSESMGFSSGAANNGIFFKSRELQLIGLGTISGRSQFGILRGVR